MKWQSTLFILGALSTQALGAKIMCNVDHDYADKGAIESGISYIRGLSGQPTAEANKCNRVSCSWGSGIYLCADDGKDHTLQNWGVLADATQAVLDTCGNDSGVKGRLMDEKGWGVAVQGAPC
ncbi:hypothetical protein N7519_009385 [Penicillium mononematosum]|uniref:uncharacterized protein n=1 Tax=Penicillium mononematosum TaxID=268346 RepID=UPI0025469A9D|nr:uncharacterized protein N7519_009385 [Penicillium mononematosum]KAJ6178924.1 hypothetical protein N7519_009385 [Penicillium mononematosum]